METGVKYTIEVTDMTVSPNGRTLVMKYLRDHRLPVDLELSIDETWKWVRQSGKYRGKLPKRLAHIIKDRYDVVLTPKQMSEIGNIAREHVLPSVVHTLDFDGELDWTAGDFGDGISCFWTCHTLARNELKKQGVLAIRLYDKEGGYARAWIYKLDDNTWILFNAYGTTTQRMANILATFLTKETAKSWEYAGIYLAVNGYSNGLIYLNAYPQAIYVNEAGSPGEVDLKWDLEEYLLCHYCEAYIEIGMEQHYRGNTYCDNCYDEVAVCCMSCGDVIDNESDEYECDEEVLCSCCYDARQEEEM